MAEPKDLSLLESLQQGLLGDILGGVVASSREDVRECLTVSKTLAEATQDDRVFKALNLRPFAMEPLLTCHPRHRQLMQKTMESANLVAFYIEGIKHYFFHDNIDVGLMFLKTSAAGSYDNAKYLFGLLLLCNGKFEEGKEQLRSLGWEKNMRLTNRCWRENLTALRYITIQRRNQYTAIINDKEFHSSLVFEFDLLFT